MKKLIMLIVFCLSVLCSIAQEVLNSYSLELGRWDPRLEDWSWETTKPCDVKFILQGDIIIANDIAKSTYITYKQTDSGEHYGVWLAYDEKKRDCTIGMYFSPKINWLIVIYDSICYRYSFTF
jgi:hypothetical protein